MVQGIPNIIVDIKNNETASSIPTYQRWATCIETNKGPVYEPILVTSNAEAKSIFNFDASGFFDIGGKGLVLTRIANPTTATPLAKGSITVKSSVESDDLFTLEAKSEGTFEIKISTIEFIGGGYTCNISAQGFPTEYYEGYTKIQNLIKKINERSKLVNGIFIAEAQTEDTIETLIDTPLVGGSDGEVDPITGKMTEDKAIQAHRKALKILEEEKIAGVFSINPEVTIQNEYAYHASQMNQPTVCRWRYALIGASSRANMNELVSRAEILNDQRVLFVGQGLIKNNGQEVEPYEATMAIASMRSKLFYGDAIFGGETKKILTGYTDVLPLTTEEDLMITTPDREYLNEHGVITFKKEYGNVTILEGITTVQPDNVEQEDEESVVNIINYIAYEIYDIAYGFIGRNITPELKTSLEEKIKTRLSDIRTNDKTLIDIKDPITPAFTVEVEIWPREQQRLGKVQVNLTIVPVHALRQIEASIVVI